MLPLKPNPQTGYLESNQNVPSASYSSFDSDKKVKFLELALKEVQTQDYPDIPALCDALGIHERTFHEHIKRDPRFGADWETIRRRYEAKLIGNLNNKSKSKFGTIATLALLKWLENRSWNEKGTLIHSTDNSREIYVNNNFNHAIDADIIDNPQITSTQSSSNESK